MKILVVYATHSGCTEDVARRIGTALRQGGAEVKVIPVESAPAPAGFDAVIVGSGVRAGKWHGPAIRWIEKHAAAVRAIPHAMFTVCLMMRDGQKKAPEVLAFTQPVFDRLDLKPVGVGLFPGWFVPEKFPLFERIILKMMKTPMGDFRDFDAVDSWVSVVAPRLGLAISMDDVPENQADPVAEGDSSLQVEM
ncbi:MAG TPA: flavodoxin domain-containing protein [Myxococcota bacterium]|nr:flavodoxin domain-containing protein [Myxococcota bacterium]